MKIKIIILIFAMFLLVPLAFAQNWDANTDKSEVMGNYSFINLHFEDNLTQSNASNRYTGQIEGNVFRNQTAQVGSFSMCTTNLGRNSLNFSQLRNAHSYSNWTLSFGFLDTTGTTSSMYIARWERDIGGDQAWQFQFQDGSDALLVDSYLVGTTTVRSQPATGSIGGTWTHFVMAASFEPEDGNYTQRLYQDGVFKEQDSALVTIIPNETLTIAELPVATDADDGNGMDGCLDEVGLYNFTFDDDFAQHANDIFVNGTPVPDPAGPPPPPPASPGLIEFTLTVADAYDATSINNITITVLNSSFSFNQSSTNGTIKLNNLTIPSFNFTYDITFRSNQSGGYLNKTFTINVTDSGSFKADIFQAVVRINVSQAVTGIAINNFNATVALQKNTSNSSGFATLFLRTGNYNVSLDADGFLSAVSNLTVANFDDSILSLEMGTANLTITAFSDTQINSFNATYVLLSTGFSKTGETSDGTLIFPMTAGTFNITINTTGFTIDHEVITITAADTLPNVTFNLFETNSVNITIFDEELNSIINSTTVTLVLDHTDQKFTNTTDTGNTFLIDMLTGEWTVLASTIFHSQRNYIFTVTTSKLTTLNLYLLNTTNGELKTFNIKNKQDQTITGATITVSNKVNNTRVTVAQRVSNFAGQVNIFLKSTNEYRFTIEADGFVTKVFDLEPIDSSYNIILTDDVLIDFTTLYSKVSYSLFPISSAINSSSNLNFSIITSSAAGFISYFGLNSSFNNTDRITNVTGSPSGGTATMTIDLVNLTGRTVSVDYFIKLSDEDLILIHRDFYISGFITEGNYSAVFFADKYKDDFTAVMKAMIIVVAAVAVIISFAEVGAPAAVSGVAGVFILIFGAIVSWIPKLAAFIAAVIIFGTFMLRRGD